MLTLGQKIYHGVMGLSLLTTIGGGGIVLADKIRKAETPESSTPHPKESRIPGKSSHLGFAGRIDLFAIEIDGKLFLQARGDSHQGALLALRSSPGSDLKFKATGVNLTLPDTERQGGRRNSDKFFKIEVGQEAFILHISLDSCELSPL